MCAFRPRQRRAGPWRLLLVAAAAATLAPAGPADAQATPQASLAAATPGGDDVPLRRRATAYWEARVARSPQVFDFYPPVELRDDLGGRPLAEGGNMQFTAFEIEGVQVDGDEATVRVAVQARVLLSRASGPAELTRKAVVSEAWQRIDGTWYKRPVPAGLGGTAPSAPESEGASAAAEAAPADPADGIEEAGNP
jgi:hypothetical protein